MVAQSLGFGSVSLFVFLGPRYCIFAQFTSGTLGRRLTPEKLSHLYSFTCIDRLDNAEFKSKRFPQIATTVFLHSSIEIFNNSGLEITQ